MAQKMRPVPPRKTSPAPSKKAPTRQMRLEKEARARRAREERLALQRTRRARRGQVFRTALLWALVFVVLYGVFVAVSIARRSEKDDSALPLLIYTEGKKDEDTRFTVEELRFGKTDYLPVSFLKEYFAITEFGDSRTRSFAICENGQYATFYLNSTTALINGQKADLSAPALLKEEELYLPVDFFTTQMPGFTLTHSTPLAANVLTIAESATRRFYLQEPTTIPPVDRATRPTPVVTPATT